MEKVYVVTAGEYSDYGIEKIFSTCEKAQEYIDIVSTLGKENFYSIQEWELDDFKVSKLYIQYCYTHFTAAADKIEIYDNNDTMVPPDSLITYPVGSFRFFFSLPYSKRLANAPNKEELLLKIARDRLAKYKAEAEEF